MRIIMRSPRPMTKKVSHKATPVKNIKGSIRRAKPLARKAGISRNGKELI